MHPIDAPEVRRDDRWQEQAECRGAAPNNTDPDTRPTDHRWFPVKTGPDNAAQARSVCAVCPVRAECLEFALVTRQRFGIWGGCDENERAAMLRARRRTHREVAPRVTRGLC